MTLSMRQGDRAQNRSSTHGANEEFAPRVYNVPAPYEFLMGLEFAASGFIRIVWVGGISGAGGVSVGWDDNVIGQSWI